MARLTEGEPRNNLSPALGPRLDPDIRRLQRWQRQAVRKRQRLTALAGLSIETSDNLQIASDALFQLDKAHLSHLFDRVGIITETFPQVYSDAERFVKATGEHPTAYPDVEDESLKVMMIRYNVDHVYNPEQTSPVTELFYEAANTELELQRLTAPPNAPRTLALIRALETDANERFKQWRDSLPPEERAKFGLTEEDKQAFRDLAEFSKWARGQEGE